METAPNLPPSSRGFDSRPRLSLKNGPSVPGSVPGATAPFEIRLSNRSDIEWTQLTGGPHLGCTEVSPGCVHCYARALMLAWHQNIVRKAYQKAGFADWETRPVWGKNAPRVRTVGFWDQARAVNRRMEKLGQHVLWFPSLIDWLDDMPAGLINQEGEWVDRVWHLAEFLRIVAETPRITWQLLTKRPECWEKQMRAVEGMERVGSHAGHILAHRWLRGDAPANIWIGTTVEDQARANERIPHLLSIPARVRFLSVEPMLGPVDIDGPHGVCGPDNYQHDNPSDPPSWLDGIHWVICGGESGPGARPMHPDWARSLREQCAAAGVPFLFKQWGEWLPVVMPRKDYSGPRLLMGSGGRTEKTDWAGIANSVGDAWGFERHGKKRAGRLLDGREHNEFPRVESEVGA